MNIAVIFTGGTIGSTVQDQYVSTDAQAPYRLLSMYEQSLRTCTQESTTDTAPDNSSVAEYPVFTTYAPYTTLSEYLDGSHLNKLIACVQDLLTKSYDGIIITHGTDTLQYTAAALGLFFAFAQTPIILVSSNYILDDPRANGLSNFAAAVDYIRNRQTRHTDSSATTQSTDYIPPLPTAVGVSYCNTGYSPHIYNALGLYEHYPFDDSLYERPYNEYADAVTPVLQEFFVLRSTMFTDSHADCTMATCFTHETASSAQPENTACAFFSHDCPVCYFRSMPGQQYYLPEDVHAVLIHAYHSGTINTKNPSLTALCKKAAKKEIPIYLTGISSDSTDYDSKAVYDTLGIIPLPEYSPIVAYMYLWYKYSHHKHPNA